MANASLADVLKNLGEIRDGGWKLVDDEAGSQSETILQPSEHKIFFKRERRKGKIVLLVGEFFLNKIDLIELMKLLKKRLAVGGAIEGRFIMLQTDNEQKIKELIKEQNFALKKP